MRRLIAAVVLGIALSAAINVAIFILTPNVGVHWRLPFSIFRAISLAFAAVLPGLLAGWIAGRSGFRVGVLVGVGIAIVSPLLTDAYWSLWPDRELLIGTAVGIITNAITQSVGGVVGETLRRRRAAL